MLLHRPKLPFISSGHRRHVIRMYKVKQLLSVLDCRVTRNEEEETEEGLDFENDNGVSFASRDRV